MKIVVYDWGGFNTQITTKHLTELGHDVEIFECKCNDYNSDMNLAMKLMEKINTRHYDALVSYNYIPIIAVACNVCNIPYYSWIFDSPHLTMFSNSIHYPTNHVGAFDRQLVEDFASRGVSTVYHVPLACDPVDMRKRIRRGSNRIANRSITTSGDVSFVGSLYTDARRLNYYDKFKSEGSKQGSEISRIWSDIDTMIDKQCFNYEEDFLTENEKIDYAYLKQLVIDEGLSLGPDYFATPQDIVVSSLLERKVTVVERQQLMSAVAAHCVNRYRFNLFTTSDTSWDKNLDAVNRGPVEYDSEMPSVFANSRINLHVTLRSIHTGIPLRVMDILSCGGFLLCDPQTEVLENFVDGEDIAVYHSVEECMDKIDYYLSHEDVRAKIAAKGQRTVEKLFNYNDMLSRLLSGGN